MLEDAEAGLARLEGAEAFDTDLPLMTTISPGAISRTNSAPTMSSAQVSDAAPRSRFPRPIRPSTSGRTPSGSRTPMSLVRVIATMENAPSTRRSASFIRSGMSVAATAPSGG
jgi:hypothetical protein